VSVNCSIYWKCCITLGNRLGPLSIEQKARAAHKPRAKLEKNKNDERKPQEIREEDIARSENETTKNVATVSASSLPHYLLKPN
jgi:hypothetical protein